MTSTILQVQKIRVYLSSPGDVAEERTLARAVLGSLQKEPGFADRLLIEEVSWDDPENPVPLDASQDPQQSINRARGKPADCDVVVVILWSRLGTPMPANIRKPDGGAYRSGTEWEFGNALAGAQKIGRPAVLLYRRDAEILISQKDPKRKEKLDQADAVDAFFRDLVNPDGSLPHGQNTYARPEDFRWLFESQLRQWLFQHLNQVGAARPEQEAGAKSTVPKGDDAGKPATETGARTFSLIDGFNRLVLLIAVAGLFGIARGGIGLPQSLQWSIAAVLVAIVGVNLAREWRAFQDRRQTRRLALTTVAPRVGYFRIGPYEDQPEDRQDFKRADQAHEKVLKWLEIASVLPLYLSGDSGSGKSSLLNASVLPALRQKGWTVVTARAYQDPEAALRNALTTTHPELAQDGMSLRDLAEAAARQCERPLLLLLDQFEEYMILASAEVQAGFRAWVADLAARPIGNLKLLLVLRAEYLTDLEKAGFPSHAHQYNWLSLSCFSRRDAHDFLKGGLNLGPADMDSLLTSAADIDGIPDNVKPITLNVLGHVLEAGGAVASGLDAGRLIRRYIDQVVAQPGVRAHAAPVLDQLITAHGTKRPRAEAELAEATGLSPLEVRAVLRGLHQAWLARPLDAASQVWELSHDFIARAVSAYLGRRPMELGRQALTWAGPALLGGLIALLGARHLTVWLETRPLLPEMVAIPAGSFCMGSRLPETPAPADCPDLPEDDEADEDETPVRRVTVSAFRLGRHEVTAGEYRRFVMAMRVKGREIHWSDEAESIYFLPDLQRKFTDRLPVVNVSFEEATEYAEWLWEAKGRQGARFRLPSEVEWEYAARAGKATKRWWGHDALNKMACSFANVMDVSLVNQRRRSYFSTGEPYGCNDGYVMTAPVGSFPTNLFGIQDILGNVYEWVSDCFHESYRGAPEGQLPWTDGGDCDYRMVRGGSWRDDSVAIRSAARYPETTYTRDNTLGFRLAQDLK